MVRDQIEQAAGSGHHDVGSAAEGHHLGIDRHPAVDDEGFEKTGQMAAAMPKGLADLHGEFAGGHKNQGPDKTASRARLRTQDLHDGQGISGSLAGARLRGGPDIPATEDRRDGRALNRRRGGVIPFAKGAQQRFGKAQ